MIDWLELAKRILRYKNYMLALVHKNILPLEHRVPFLGDVIFFSEGLKFNIEWILFGTYLTNPWAPFSSFQLKRKTPSLKTSTWKEYVFGWMSHPTYVISLSPQAKWDMLIWFKYLIPLTCLKIHWDTNHNFSSI